MEILHSYQTILPEGICEAFVSIENGKIVRIQSSAEDINQTLVTELGNAVLMPGVIDPHVHINEPGRTDWEGFDTATKAAIACGVTTLIDMPLNSAPVTTTVDAFRLKLAATHGKLHTHVGFWGGIIPGNEAEIEPLIKTGVKGFKAFLTHSGIDDFPNATAADLDKAMPIIAKYQLPLLVHCELTDNIVRATGNPESYANYLASRPKAWEDEAIDMMIRLCEKHGCHVHIVHLSSANSLAIIEEARQQGLPLTVETGQHYLYFNAEDIPDGKTAYKCAPPIREKANNDLLWQALQAGTIDFVATDHSPATPDLKEIESGNLMKAWGGIASIQLALPVLWTAAKKRGIPVQKMAEWLCSNPAKLAGLAAQKGSIAVGMDADLVVWQADESFVVTEELLFHKHKVTPYIGQTLFGVVQQTRLKGNIVYQKGQFVQTNQGNLLVP